MSDNFKVSVIIPTLNEEETLPRVLAHLQTLTPAVDEVIVIDGGSEDGTIEIANQYGCSVLISRKQSRSIQLDLGAREATGDFLVFLHADTWVPDDLVEQVTHVLGKEKNKLGAFVSVMRGERLRVWFSFLNYIKTYLCPLFYRPVSFLRGRLLLLFGDQVMFCRKQDYLEIGGFDTSMEVMEEADFCMRMSKLGRTRMVHRFVFSSDRRVAEWGFWKANRIYWFITFGWAFGANHRKMADLYTDIR